MDATKLVLDAFAKSDKPLKAAQLVDELGLDREVINAAIKELKAEGKIVSPKVCFYTVAK